MLGLARQQHFTNVVFLIIEKLCEDANPTLYDDSYEELLLRKFVEELTLPIST